MERDMSEAPERIWAERDGEGIIVHPDGELMWTGYVHEYIRADLVHAEIDQMKVENAQAFSAGHEAGEASVVEERDGLRKALEAAAGRLGWCGRRLQDAYYVDKAYEWEAEALAALSPDDKGEG